MPRLPGHPTFVTPVEQSHCVSPVSVTDIDAISRAARKDDYPLARADPNQALVHWVVVAISRRVEGRRGPLLQHTSMRRIPCGRLEGGIIRHDKQLRPESQHPYRLEQRRYDHGSAGYNALTWSCQIRQ